MTLTARQLRQPPTIEAIERVLYFANVLNVTIMIYYMQTLDKQALNLKN